MAAIFRRGDTWYLTWREGNSRRRASLGTASRRAAERLLAAKVEELNRARYSNVVALPGPSVEALTIEQYVTEEYLPWRAAEYPDTQRREEGRWANHLLDTFGSIQLDRLSIGAVDRYKRERAKEKPKPSAATIAKELRSLQAAMNRAVFLKLIPSNPIRGVKPPQDLRSAPPEWYTAAQLEALYQHSQHRPGDEAAKGHPPRGWADWAPVWRLLANTGMRRMEAINLRWRDVTDQGIRILSTDGARTKSGLWRLVPLSDGAKAALEALKGMTGTTDYVLPRVHPDAVGAAFSRHAKRAGLPGSLHCLRHTFCSQLVTAGVPLRTVQKLAGHASFATTERYAHLEPGALFDAVKALKL